MVYAEERTPYDYRADPTVPRFALRTDRDRRFRLLAAQSVIGSALYRHFGLDPFQYETYILLDEGRAFFRSEASIRIFEGLGGPWRFAFVGRALPLWARDGLYNFIARNRFRWFGTRQTCYLPDPSQADRFIS